MESLSWTRELPPRPPDKWEFDGPKPDGYRWPWASLSIGLYLVCAECGAAVHPPSHEQHTAWHAGG